MQSRGLNESPSDDRTDRVTNRRYFDPCNAATAELYRRGLSNHYWSVGNSRQRQRSSGLTSAAADSSNRGRGPWPAETAVHILDRRLGVRMRGRDPRGARHVSRRVSPRSKGGLL